MRIEGTVQSVAPDMVQDPQTGQMVHSGYQSRGGYIYNFQMTVTGQAGTVSGQIGSKSQTYPVAVGQPIIVEHSDSQYGPRLKKINPQYAGQGQAPQAGQGGKPKVDWDKIARGKVLCNIVCAGIQSGQIVVTDKTAAEQWMEFIMGTQDVQPQPAPQQQQPPVQDTTDYSQADPNDGIPF